MKFFKEFKEFAMKGNVLDLAIGVIIGSAFGTIVTSLVNDIFMPLISLLTRGINIAGLQVLLGRGENAAALRYGAFLSAIFNFVIIALSIFIFVRGINRLRKPKSAPAKVVRLCPFCLSPIADAATRCPHCTSHLQSPETKGENSDL